MTNRGKHWSPLGKGRPSYTRGEMDEAEADSPLAVCEHHQRGIKVEIEYIGEGLEGDFHHADPQDIPLVRFRVFDYLRDEDDYEYDTYCTMIPATMPLKQLESFACELAERLADTDEGWKRLLERWSWTNEEDVRRIHAKREAQEKKEKKEKRKKGEGKK
jgi:hypothetical protein